MSRFSLSRQRLRYLLETRHISPVERVSGIGLYGPEEVARIEQALAEMKSSRGAVK
jgi:hypothetical protein